MGDSILEYIGLDREILLYTQGEKENNGRYERQMGNISLHGGR